MKRITCDHCNQQFELTLLAEQTAAGELQYFVCPHCQSRYNSALITPRGIQLRAELQKLTAILKISKDKRIRQRHDRLLQDYQHEVQKP